MEAARNPDIITLSEDEESIHPTKVSEGEPAFANVQDDDDDEDALTTEEELCLRQDTMREFFLQQLKVLRESVVSSQTKMQEDLKASSEATETNLKEELNHYTERLEARVQTDLQMLDEHFKAAGHRVEEMVKAMAESVTKRMNDMDKKLDGLASRITAMEVEVCSMVASTSFVESIPFPVLTADRAVDQPSEEAEALSSTQVPDEGSVTEISVDIESLPPLSPISPGQGAVLTTSMYIETITDQLLEEAEALSSTQVPDEGGVTEISVDLLSLPVSSGYQKRPILHKRKLAHSFEDLEPELVVKLRPYTSQKCTKQEKLTGLQAAYFDLQMDRLKITGMFTFSFPLCVEAS
ncbi:uncharacterized protein LOC107723286 [Sinocyclocheilus rhinocerous]|uniref:uncharacterized protein LOC107723286 n=1 Tax=Sinocyclocheilus rhinocerous TaxID=307959 RepID=UPI0007B91F28|nr:PREDICTED: uncharacterized protein LOC107723286 [Sinocyclocheilus rhinocerous]